MHTRIFINFIFACFWMVLVANPSSAQYPPIRQCPNRQAVAYSDEIVAQLNANQDWFVARVTVQSQIPSQQWNSCAPLSYYSDCSNGAILINRQFSQFGTIQQTTQAYNPQDQSIVVYDEGRQFDDQNYFIFSGSINRMSIYQQDNFGRVLKIYDNNYNFPPLVQFTEASQYAMPTYFQTQDGVITWAEYEACDQDLAWIEVNQYVVDNNMLYQVNQEIENYIARSSFLSQLPIVAPTRTLPFVINAN